MLIKVFKNRFKEGEFRKRVQSIPGGKLHKIKFKCYVWILEYLLARIPPAEE